MATEGRVMELDAKVKELEEQLQSLRERSVRLVDMERRRCLEYVPSKGKLTYVTIHTYECILSVAQSRVKVSFI